MKYVARAEKVKVENIVDMAITFTAMLRVFKDGSKEKLTAQVLAILSCFDGVLTCEDYNALHTDFCLWFTSNIQTASKTLKNGREIESHAPSWGHAAKVFDIAMKVCVYYCHLPAPEVAARVGPMLKGAIDTPILEHLKRNSKAKFVAATNIEQVDRQTYELLQGLIDVESQEKGILPVQYDDLMWREFNRNQPDQSS